ncbi:Uncharacterised protein [Mycobacteroides abscessus subsp. abscessus]|uniref:hypothetical protein n=1 Tax=Mycobacteroides abscessus TaxID=36809 RepID=UPI000927CB99|nr:hypothetical protein [Mycobacteroides abscessus]SHV14800.1 Uncharacterised protein [Mycobacteroides abscessus subsp. abscessus]SKD11166.1 Uncharacterised protein [Mycobacteroides abscessus subsp. abscessus]SKL37646.1 Uncharacterised protein [Mycobacteroides abscessus subsp. abscessus]SKM28138.1 Uncharacterised protein [Mycobacteroides abscessus subsp. abscessus]
MTTVIEPNEERYPLDIESVLEQVSTHNAELLTYLRKGMELEGLAIEGTKAWRAVSAHNAELLACMRSSISLETMLRQEVEQGDTILELRLREWSKDV